MAKKQNEYSELHFLFTKTGFYIDDTYSITNEKAKDLQEKFMNNKWKTLYEFNFITDTIGLSLSASFLHKLSESFFNELIKLPELEIAREQVEFKLNDEKLEKLLHAVPFSAGSEHITKEWIQLVFQHLKNIYAEEIINYPGSIQMY